MRMTADLGENVFTPLGSYRHVQGEYDPEWGVLWIDAAGQGTNCSVLEQKEGKRVGILLISKVVVMVDVPKPAAKPAEPKR